MSDPLAYLLTWHAFGTWLPGEQHGSVDDKHDVFGTPFVPADPDRVARAREEMAHPSVTLDGPKRLAVHEAVVEVCSYRKWALLALHVRTTHAHAVVTAPVPPEKVMSDFKAYATRRLRRDGLVAATARVWSSHGSTRYLWTGERVLAAVEYVVNRQGAPLGPPPLDNRQLFTGHETRPGADASGR
jgi:REP element-mobilizing transposase RayT